MTMTLLGTKFLNLGLDIFIALFGAFLPSFPFIANSKKADLFMELGNCFAGGVFLTVGLVHLLPNAEQSMAKYFDQVGITDGRAQYPWVTVLAAAGTLITLGVEKMKLHSHNHKSIVEPLMPINNTSNNFTDYSVANSNQPAEGTKRMGFLLLLVLSVHSFLAGLAVGMATDLEDSITLLIAIVAHKGFAAFALGVTLKTSGITWKQQVIELLFFTFMTPCGIAVGMGVSEALQDSSALNAFSAIAQGLAAGTFITISIEDIIGKEMAKPLNLAVKLTLMGLGWCGMSIVAWWT